MERKNKIFWTILITAVILFALVVYNHLAFLQDKMRVYINVYGYLAIFILGFLTDTSDQPLGPEFVAGLAVAVGFNPLLSLLLASLGSGLVMMIQLHIGRKYFTKKIATSCSTKQYSFYCKIFGKYGKLVVFLAAVTPIPYIFITWVAGAFHMRMSDYLLYGPLARAGRVLVIVILVLALIG